MELLDPIIQLILHQCLKDKSQVHLTEVSKVWRVLCRREIFRGDVQRMELFIVGHHLIEKLPPSFSFTTMGIMNRCARRGDKNSLALLRQSGYNWNEWVMTEAAREKHFHLLPWLREQDCPWGRNLLGAIGLHGTLSDVIQAHQQGCPWDTLTYVGPARANKIDILTWLNFGGCPWDERTLTDSIKKDNLEAIQWLYQNGCPWDETAPVQAAKMEAWDIVAWLHEAGCPWDEETWKPAITHQQRLEWLLEKGCPWSSETILFAAKEGHLTTVRWLVEQGCPYYDDGSIAGEVAARGELETLQWLRQNKGRFTARTFRLAVQQKDIKIVEYLEQIGCPMSRKVRPAEIMTSAARAHGYPGHLLWLSERGCPVDESTMMALAGRGDLPGMVWLMKKGCPLSKECLVSAVRSGNPKVIWWLQRQGCPFSDHTMQAAVFSGKLSTVEWLHEKGCPWGKNNLIAAVRQGRVKLVKWMLKHGCPINQEQLKKDEPLLHPLMIKLLQRKKLL